jgi:hypothetical protein
MRIAYHADAVTSVNNNELEVSLQKQQTGYMGHVAQN